MSLAQKMKQEGERARSAADGAIEGLANVASDLEMQETAAGLHRSRERLKSDTFNLIVMGRFKNGKSTMLNALLGGTTRPVDLDGQKGPMVVDDLPATAILTGVRYADEPSVHAWRFDGKRENWSLARYLRESTLGIDDEENQRRFQEIREFEMGFPATLCQAGLMVYDSPGLDEHATRTTITREATARCDAAIVVYKSDALMGQSELMDAARIVAEGTRVFTVVNLWGNRRLDDRLTGYVWNKYVRDQLGGSPWAHQDPASRDIYFINAEVAKEARYTGDEPGVAESGLALFEQRLADFLLRDRQHVHLQKHVILATTVAAAIEQQISHRRTGLHADQQRLREAYTRLRPELEATRARPNKLPPIFTRYRAEAERALAASFQHMIARLRTEVPTHLTETPLPSGEQFFKIFHQKKLQEEASGIASEFIVKQIEEWNTKDVPGLLTPILDRLQGEIEGEIAAIERRIEEMHLELTGGRVEGTESVVGTTERVLSAAAGFFLGFSVLGALTGGAGGWRGAVGSIAGSFGTTAVLLAVGATSAIVFFPAVLAGSLILGTVMGGRGLEGRVKKKCTEKIDEVLRQMAVEAAPKIGLQLAEKLQVLESTVMKQVMASTEEQARNIEQIVELNQRDQAGRDRALAALDEASARVVAQRQTLQEALITIRQTT